MAFRDPEARAALDRITHPRIAARIAEGIERLSAAGCPRVVLEVPLLYETGMDAGMDEVVVVWTDPATQASRIRGRNVWTDDEIAGRIGSQMPVDEKKARARIVIDNSGTTEETRRQVDRLWERWGREDA